MTIHVMVTGSRQDSAELRDTVREALTRYCAEVVFVGCCPTGADAYAREWCDERGITPTVIKADWNRFGPAAGPRRNSALVRRAKEWGAFVLAFPRGGPGTADCIAKAARAGLSVREL